MACAILRGRWMRAARALSAVLALLGLAAGPVLGQTATPAAGAIPLAVLGDSNSHSYQDRISFPPGNFQRGGPMRAISLQWTEVLARLRGGELDPGPWEVSGVSAPWLRVLDAVGRPVARAPRKEDYRYNYANDGATCDELVNTHRRQMPHLVVQMDRAPERWRGGVIVIRFGMAELGQVEVLDAQAHDPQSPLVHERVQNCLRRIGEAVTMLRLRHPATHVVLVGLDNDAHDPGNLGRWRSAGEMRNIEQMCDTFDEGLQRIAAANRRVSFFDERGWFRKHWGGRDAEGQPAYKAVAIGPTLRVTNTMGDAPSNALLADDHAGLVWNALWAQTLVAHLREAGLPLTPIGDEELTRFVLGLAAAVNRP